MGNDAGMKYTSAYLLCAMGGVEPTKAAIVKIFESAGVSYEAALIDLVFKKMDGRDLQETIKNGRGFLEIAAVHLLEAVFISGNGVVLRDMGWVEGDRRWWGRRGCTN